MPTKTKDEEKVPVLKGSEGKFDLSCRFSHLRLAYSGRQDIEVSEEGRHLSSPPILILIQSAAQMNRPYGAGKIADRCPL